MKRKPAVMIVIVVLFVLLFGSCGQPAETKKSFDNAFEILEMIEANDNSVVFAVHPCDGYWEDIAFVSPRYSHLFVTQVYWANRNYDFFVLSHDTGVHPYIFQNGTWESGYVLKTTSSEQSGVSVRLVKAPTEGPSEISTEYDIDNIPQEIIDYLLNH